MVEPDHTGLAISQQCKLLAIARLSFYYMPKSETEHNLGLMRLSDEQFLENAVLRRPPSDVASAQRRTPCEREKNTAADAHDSVDANLQEAQHEQAGEELQNLSLPA